MFVDGLVRFREILEPLGEPSLLELLKWCRTPAAVERCSLSKRAVPLPHTTAAGLSKNIQARFCENLVGSAMFCAIPHDCTSHVLLLA